MMLRYSFGYLNEADKLDLAVENVLKSGARTADIATQFQKTVSCSEMADKVVAELEKLLTIS